MDESNAPKNRQSRRSHVLMTASLELSGAALTVKLRNLSADGALVEGDNLPVEGAAILFRKGDIAVAGKLVWVQGAKGGVSFDKPIPEELLLRNIPQPRSRIVPNFRRPSLKEEPTAAERQFAARWIQGAERLD